MPEIDDSKLTISTPEQVALEFQLAGIGSRFMAFLVDSLIEGVAFLVLGIALFLAGLSLSLRAASASNWAVALLVLVGFTLYWGYFAIFEALWGGQTPGKRLVGIRVVKDSGRAIQPSEAVSRNLLRVIDQLPGIYVFGLISILVSKERKRIGDFVAGTVVVHEKGAVEVYPDLQKLDENVPVLEWTLKLTNRDLQLIESFLHRSLSLPPDVRAASTIRIVEHLCNKTGEKPEPGQSEEDFLQKVAIAIRNSRSRRG
jgi:uncharacterized RDD family membrane protein YckC